MNEKKTNTNPIYKIILIPLALSLIFTVCLTIFSTTDNLFTGPRIKKEIINSFAFYAIWALSRLAFFSFVLSFSFSLISSISYISIIRLLKFKYNTYLHLIFVAIGLSLIIVLAFIHNLFYLPSNIAVSFNYNILRLLPLWDTLSPTTILISKLIVYSILFLPILLYGLVSLLTEKNIAISSSLLLFLSICLVVYLYANWKSEPNTTSIHKKNASKKFNIIMIGSDTLRADRIGVNGNQLNLTPAIDSLAKKSINFSSCIVPIARTAPSLTSLLTSSWPHTHQKRFNFLGDDETSLNLPSLPEVLKNNGYITAAVGDWAAGDLGKIDFQFDLTYLPEDQWNLKFLLRQGPKTLRLFLSLFSHNNLGKLFLPEIYYLAGVPLTKEIGIESRNIINKLSNTNKPFFINIFIASTHGPFGSPWPYYRLYADPNYRGKSFFVMSGVSNPEDIVKSQESDKYSFDINQIFSLYNGAVKSFDDEVSKIIKYINDTGLINNTIVIIYSDHGTDLFENKSWGQGNILSDFSYRIPLVLYIPNQLYQPKNISSTISSIDIAPTILDILDIPSPEKWEGKTLKTMFTSIKPAEDRVVFGETGIWIANVPGLPKNRIPYPSILELLEIKNNKTGTLSIKREYKETLIKAKAKMARKGKWELVYFPTVNGGEYALYNIDKDPALLSDLSEFHPDIVEILKKSLTEWYSHDNL